MAHKRAVIDLGTNTFQLLVGSCMDGNSPLEVHVNLQRPVQLGKGAMERGVIQTDALIRAQVVLAEFVEIAASHGCEVNEITALATSILRNALNGMDVLMEWRRSLGIHVELISGLREAELIFEGVSQSLPQPWEQPTLLMDIGGGSVEFILFQGAEVHFKMSLELGGLKLLSLFNQTDSFDLAFKEDCIKYIDYHLQPLFEACGHLPNVLIGAAGAFETIWDIEQALKGGGTEKKQAYALDISCFYQVKGAIERMEPGERAHFPGMREFRAGIFPYANLLVDRVLTRLDIQDMWMSTNSLKEGFWYSQRDEAIKKGIIF